MAIPGQAAMLNTAQSIIGYTFTDVSILWEALQAPGAPKIGANGRDFTNGNKRIALLGDVVLKMVLLEDWYSGPGNIQIGNHRVTTIGNNSNLAQSGRTHGLDTCVHNNPSALGVVSNGVMAQTVEAILGAVWLDSGAGCLGAVRAVMTTLGLV